MTAIRLVASALAPLLALPLGAAAQGSARPLLKKYGPPTNPDLAVSLQVGVVDQAVARRTGTWNA